MSEEELREQLAQRDQEIDRLRKDMELYRRKNDSDNTRWGLAIFAAIALLLGFCTVAEY